MKGDGKKRVTGRYEDCYRLGIHRVAVNAGDVTVRGDQSTCVSRRFMLVEKKGKKSKGGRAE